LKHWTRRNKIRFFILLRTTVYVEQAVVQLVEALRYKPKGRGFVPGGVIGLFN
jgi:hypothetical protein